MKKLLSSFVLIACILNGCAHQSQLSKAESSVFDNHNESLFFISQIPISKDRQQIFPGFKIRVNNQLDPKLNFTARVNENGLFAMPYGKVIKVEPGLLIIDFLKQIQAVYHNFFKTKNQYQIQIVEATHYLKVSGNISKPGLYLVAPHDRIEDVLARSHSETQIKRPNYLQIKRGEQQYLVDLVSYFQGNRPQQQAYLSWTGQEEFIFLDQAAPGTTDLVYVMGDVRQPGGVRFHNQLDIVDYINKAGGFTNSSDQDRISIIRKSGGYRTQVNGDWVKLSNQVVLAPNDTVIVGSSLPTRFERRVQVGSMIASILSAIGILLIAF